eukprot:TRINITY_DN3706_c0_g3_i2.p1 TRINITY_DN3706_c0_g3~~TRINITY_DN3706_c0_g3_i2.p1  ORF type:complete len:415 (+),score=63.18 TRINITY_DN3706_c0_g3_i2:56-1246(+)
MKRSIVSLLLLFIVLNISQLCVGDEGCGCSSASRSSLLKTTEGEAINEISNNEQISQEGETQEKSGGVNSYENEDLEGLVLIKGGTFRMGTDSKYVYPMDGETPIKTVFLDDYYFEETEVTNRDFKKFIDATQHKTEAEAFGWSFVFHHFIKEDLLDTITEAVQNAEWWLPVNNATWLHPEGPQTLLDDPLYINYLGYEYSGERIENPNIAEDHKHKLKEVAGDRWSHPAIHISWNDANAYCEWKGRRLPTEAEWEYAARGGLKRKLFPWGNELTPNGQHLMNIWQGFFPVINELGDGYYSTAPVKAFPPNLFGVYGTVGNVWEWCSDWFTNVHEKLELSNPQGPLTGTEKVMRGGSFLCHESYCHRYRLSARSKITPDSSTGNLGFRCAKDVLKK